MNSILTKIQALPKADVHSHLHLAGSQKRFAERYPNANITFPSRYNGLSGMIDFIYGTLNKVMATSEDVTNFMDIAIQSAIDDNVKLLEASVDAGLARFFDNSIDAVIETVQTLQERYNSEIDFKPDLGINKDLALEKVYSDGVKCIESGVFKGIDLYGQEVGKDLTPFVRLYDMAKDHGLKTKVHIGEFSDHFTIENTIKLLNPQELQHGIRAVDSKKTMDLILEKNIRLNMCPTSNLSLGAVTHLENHPVRKLFDHGIKVTINTDDLILFNATITEEYEKLWHSQLFTFEEIELLNSNALTL